MESPPCSSKHAHVKLFVDVQTHPNTPPFHLHFPTIHMDQAWKQEPIWKYRRVHSGKTWSLSDTLGYTWYFCRKLWQKWPVRWPSSQVSVVRIQQWTSCGWQRDGILACRSRLANVMHPTRPLSPMLSQRWCMAELQDVARCCKMLQDVARCCKMLQDVAKLEVMSCPLSSFGVPLKDVIKAVSAAASKSSGAFCSYRSKQFEYQNVVEECRNLGALKISKMHWIRLESASFVYTSLLFAPQGC